MEKEHTTELCKSSKITTNFEKSGGGCRRLYFDYD